MLGRQLPWLILLVGGIAAPWAAWHLHVQIERDARAAFGIHSLDFQHSIENGLRRYEDLLFSMAAFYGSSDSVEPGEFQAFGESLKITARTPAIAAINYAEYVPVAEREKFARAFEEELRPHVKNLLPPRLLPGRSEYMVITRMFPPSKPGLGLDLFSNPRRYTDDESPPFTSDMYEPGRPVSTGMPLRARGQSHTVLAARMGVFEYDSAGKARLRGTVGLGIDVSGMFKAAVPTSLADHVTYRVENVGRTDGTTYPPVPIFTNLFTGATPGAIRAEPGEIYTDSFTVPFGEALLRFELSSARSQLISNRDRLLPLAVLVGGLLLTWMASVLSRKTLLRNQELNLAISRQTAELRREIDRSRQLEREVAHIAEEERRRIGREVHDDLGQRLTRITLFSKALSEALWRVSPFFSEQAAGLEREAADAISSARAIAHGLMPVPEGKGGLRAALEQLALGVSASGNLRCTFDFDEPVDVENADVASNLFRIAQEAVSNAIRHGLATTVEIRLDGEGGRVTLTVKDNGAGFIHDVARDPEAPQTSGAGLRIMAYRASVINYTLTVDAAPGCGTVIKVQEC